MIYITGDTHMGIDIHKLSVTRFPEQKLLNKQDYVIVLGDFGMVWNDGKEELYWRRWLDQKPWTTLFIDGNHDNHPLLDSFPAEQKFEGTVRKISDSIYFLPRGEVYTIDGITFLTMGGADSVDKLWRIQYEKDTGKKIWWKSEQITSEQILDGLDNVDRKLGGRVDVVLSHAAPFFVERQIREHIVQSPSSLLLQDLAYQLDCKMWFFGHYHVDNTYTDRYGIRQYVGLYQQVYPLRLSI